MENKEIINTKTQEKTTIYDLRVNFLYEMITEHVTSEWQFLKNHAYKNYSLNDDINEEIENVKNDMSYEEIIKYGWNMFEELSDDWKIIHKTNYEKSLAELNKLTMSGNSKFITVTQSLDDLKKKN